MTPHQENEKTIRLENDWLQLTILANAPRILGLNLLGQPNLFASLPHKNAPTPYGVFQFRGGHRLWHAPESMPRTYIPEAGNAEASFFANGLRMDQPAEAWTMIAKSLEIHLNPHQPQVLLRHELRNEGAWAVELAPWALTMFRLGGVGIFPQPNAPQDSAGLLPNRHLSVWSYTQLTDPRLTLRDDFLLLRANPSLPPLKLGYFNPQGWQAYLLQGVLFVKHFPANPGANLPDGGCNTETYCGDEFIELESLAPLQRLEPGETAQHTETWEVYANPAECPLLPGELLQSLTQPG
jgi:hypothetical protein